MALALAVLPALLMAVNSAPSANLREVNLQAIPPQLLVSSHASPADGIALTSSQRLNTAGYVIPIQADTASHVANQQAFTLYSNPAKYILDPSSSIKLYEPSSPNTSPTRGFIPATAPQSSATINNIPQIFMLAYPADAGVLSTGSAKSLNLYQQNRPLALPVDLEPASLEIESSEIPFFGKAIAPGQTSHSSPDFLSQEQVTEDLLYSSVPYQHRSLLVPSNKINPVHAQHQSAEPSPSNYAVRLNQANIHLPSNLNYEANPGQQTIPFTSLSQKQVPPASAEISSQVQLQNPSSAKTQISSAASGVPQGYNLNNSPISNAPSSAANIEENQVKSLINPTMFQNIQGSALVSHDSVENVISNPPSQLSIKALDSAKNHLGTVSHLSSGQITPNLSSVTNRQDPPTSV